MQRSKFHTNIDLTALAALPYAGQAAKVIREQVDPEWGLGPNEQKFWRFDIEVGVSRTETVTVDVRGGTLKDAERRAIQQAIDEADIQPDEIVSTTEIIFHEEVDET